MIIYIYWHNTKGGMDILYSTSKCRHRTCTYIILDTQPLTLLSFI